MPRSITFASTALLVCLYARDAVAQVQIDSTLLPPVVVTATRVDSASGRGVTSASVIHAAELRSKGIRTLGDALRLVPGAQVVQTSAPGSESALFIRGGERDFVLVLIDGVPANEPGGFVNLAHLSLDNVERIEVVRGPVSVLYGSDAVSGVVQIFTRKPADTRRAEALMQMGTRGARTMEVSQSSAGSVASYSLGAARYRSDGIYDLNNGYRNDSYSGKLGIGDKRRMSAELSARFTEARYAYPTTFYGAPIDSNSFNGERRFTGGLELTRQMGDATDITAGARYTRQVTTLADPVDATTPFPFEQRTEQLRRGFGARLNHRLDQRAVLTGGAEYELQESTTEGGPSPSSDPLLERWSRGLFAQLMATSEKDVDLTLGARADDNQRFGTFVTWRVGLGIPIDSVTRIRGAMGTAFREPQFFEITGGGFAKPNASLEPERTRSWELAFEYAIPRARSFVSATYFMQRFRDLIIFANLDSDPDYFNQYQNGDRSRASGWEFELRSDILRDVRVSTGYTMLKTRIGGTGPDAGRPLPRRPTGFGNASIVWTPDPGVTLGGDVTYVGRRRDTRFFAEDPPLEERLGGYARVDLSAQYDVTRGSGRGAPVFLTLRVENALDREIEAVSGFATPGRLFSFGARVLLDY